MLLWGLLSQQGITPLLIQLQQLGLCKLAPIRYQTQIEKYLRVIGYMLNDLKNSNYLS
jgi:hypothetical protein